ncbi:MAG: EcsC family protein [Actinomycetota bacterium]|uniref:EcsC family protein n=1 Tax=Mycobacterium lentiflavum TaxID=141349 RepID=A0ABY3UM41_MYCLN|nr:EcsC family protein [Mycobacterium lentiflavum]MEE3062744.1 EcsC family protein [Actinomycetota bacterium]ULP40666.1 EcsC family protein [Mycobacterium lentiflavum]
MALSGYEQEQLKKVTAHKQRSLRPPRRLIPAIPDRVRGIGPDLVNKALKVSGLDKVADSGAALLGTTAANAGKFMTKTGQMTTSPSLVIGAYARKGHAVEHLDDIRKLDLRTIDDVAAFAFTRHAYSISAAVEGAAAGLAISSGEAVATVGAAGTAGVAAGPGLGTVVTAMGVDAAVLLTACSSVVAQDALYYGYDPFDPAEEIFMMQVIGLGLAGTPSAKAAAYQQLAVLTERLARNAAWHELDEQTFAKVAQKFAVKFTEKLARSKVFQLAPVVGVGIGAALNWKTVADIADAAYWAYRERFLYDKSGNVEPIDVDAADDSDDEALDLIDILNSEGIDVDGADTDEDE